MQGVAPISQVERLIAIEENLENLNTKVGEMNKTIADFFKANGSFQKMCISINQNTGDINALKERDDRDLKLLGAALAIFSIIITIVGVVISKLI